MNALQVMRLREGCQTELGGGATGLVTPLGAPSLQSSGGGLRGLPGLFTHSPAWCVTVVLVVLFVGVRLQEAFRTVHVAL